MDLTILIWCWPVIAALLIPAVYAFDYVFIDGRLSDDIFDSFLAVLIGSFFWPVVLVLGLIALFYLLMFKVFVFVMEKVKSKVESWLGQSNDKKKEKVLRP